MKPVKILSVDDEMDLELLLTRIFLCPQWFGSPYYLVAGERHQHHSLRH